MPAPICTFLTHSQPDDCGDFRHRILWPARALGEYTSTMVIQMTHPNVLQFITTTDVLVICMVVEEILEEVIKLRKAAGLPTIYEISDDFMEFPKNTQMAPFYSQPKVRLQLIALARASDAVQYSSPKLQQKYNYINAVSTVFMNQVWNIPENKEQNMHSPLRIGWTASGGHVMDAIELGRYLHEALANIPEDSYELSAMTTKNVFDALCLSGLTVAQHPTGSWEDYLSYLSSIDVGLAHLNDDDFAQGRSDGKYIEYASQGVVAICKNSGTYEYTITTGKNAFLYDTPEGLGNILRELISNPNLISDIRNQAYQDLQNNRNHRIAAKKRLTFYESLYPHKATNEQTGYTRLSDPIEERLMILMEEQNDNPSKELIQRYQALIKEIPNAYQAWQYLFMLFTQLDIHKKRNLIEQRYKQLQELALNNAKEQLLQRSYLTQN